MTNTIPMISIDSVDAVERGRQRGRALKDRLSDGIRIYLALFETCGIRPDQVRRGADATFAATEAWAPELAAEMRGTAEAADVPLWQIAALNARTEILSGSRGAKPGECSTIINASGRPVGAQTWDWHEELGDGWHLQRVRAEREFVGLTEHGILSKVGVNDSGVGILLNILGHRADRADGVPVHLVGARVLTEARTLDEAVDILRTAPVSTSSAITVLSPDGAVIVELSPLGAAVITPTDGVLLHTNHFLDPQLSVDEKSGIYDPDSQLRLGVLTERVSKGTLPAEADALVPYLVSHPGDVAALCCVPDPAAVFGDRWATLATVTIDAGARTMTVTRGTPAEVSHRGAVVLAAS